MDWISSLLLATVRLAIPLLLISLAELYGQRAGMVNIGLEGLASIGALVGFLVCSMGIQKGVEKVTKVMMLSLLALIILLTVHSMTLEGGLEGLQFYLVPDLRRMLDTGVGTVLVAAMNQAFFTLSLGIGAMEIFGSYMSRDNAIPGEAVRICGLDTLVAVMSGLIIFPACFAYQVTPDQGPSLIFLTLPHVFTGMPGGRVWGALFFLFMTFASFSTVIAVFENLMSGCMDHFGWSRRKTAVINCVVVLVASLPCVLGYNVWSDLRLIGGRDVLDSEDFIVSNLLLPIGSLIYLLFCVSRWGWGYDRYLTEVNTGRGLKLSRSRWMKYYLQFVLPALIVLVLLQGLL